MNRFYRLRAVIFIIILFICCSVSHLYAVSNHPVSSNTSVSKETHSETIKKVLIIGDSMTGWLAERLNAYGQKDGFQVATVVWDGSTIKKWASSNRLSSLIKEQDPDVVFICLGMNELFTPKPGETLEPFLKKILSAVGNRELLWIGPPSWPGKKGGEALNTWLSTKLGSERFFNSSQLSLPRQSRTNPHPTRVAVCKWMDDIMKWIPEHTDLHFPSLTSPSEGAMSRGKIFIYKRMKESL